MSSTAELHLRPARTNRDLRPAARWFAAILLPIGPLAIAVLRYVLPYDTTDSVSTAVGKIAAHPGSERLVLWLTLVAMLTLVPGTYAAVKLAAHGAPVLAAIAGLLIVPAYLSLFGIALVDEIGMSVTSSGLSRANVAAVATFVNQFPTTTIFTVVFVLGHVVGLIVLSFALRRSGQVGRLGCVILGVSQPIHFVAAVSGNHPLDLVGWTMTAVGLAFASRAIIALRDDDWALAPRVAPASTVNYDASSSNRK